MRLVSPPSDWISDAISIHASRMGCDGIFSVDTHAKTISIHASRMGCDHDRYAIAQHPENFNPRIPYGMRLWPDYCQHNRPYFNPRIPYGMRLYILCYNSYVNDFNPRIPYGMRPGGTFKRSLTSAISIHASRMGCDDDAEIRQHQRRDFNPRIPYGMRPA